eukprot:gene8976-16618_t
MLESGPIKIQFVKNCNSSRKRKEKSGNEKRREKKQRELLESGNAQGQTLVSNFFERKATRPIIRSSSDMPIEPVCEGINSQCGEAEGRYEQLEHEPLTFAGEETHVDYMIFLASGTTTATCTATTGSEERTEVRKSRTNYLYVDARSRSFPAIRSEVILSAINFLGQRLQVEDDGTVTKIKTILAATSPKQIIDASRDSKHT